MTLQVSGELSLVALLGRALHGMSTSHANYRLAYLTDFACATAFGYLGLQAGATWHGVTSLVLGAFAFTFVEYALHRWFFHSNSLFAGKLHREHHDDPTQPAALPFWSSAFSAPALFWVLSQAMSPAVAHWALCGFFTAYLCYGILHHFQHSVRIKGVPFEWLRRKWIAHAVHHGRIDVNFGVTTSLWDRILGTYRPPAR